MINPAVRNSIRGSGRQAYPHQVARALPRAGLLLYLSAPNSTGKFLLPADATIRAATGWVTGVGNIFYDAAGDPIAVLASEIAAWASINQWNVLFHLVSADTETGRLAIYDPLTVSFATLARAYKVLRSEQHTSGVTYTTPFIDQIGNNTRTLYGLQYIHLSGATDFTNASIVGTETVASQPAGTATITIAAGKLAIAAGDLWSFSLSNGSTYEFGTILTATTGVVFDTSGNGRHLLFTVADAAAVCISGSREKGSDHCDTDGFCRYENLIKYSEDFTNAKWETPGGVRPIRVAGIGPNGEDAFLINPSGWANIVQYNNVGRAIGDRAGITFLVKTVSGNNSNLVFYLNSSNYRGFTITGQWKEYTVYKTLTAAMNPQIRTASEPFYVCRCHVFTPEAKGHYIPTTASEIFLSNRPLQGAVANIPQTMPRVLHIACEGDSRTNTPSPSTTYYPQFLGGLIDNSIIYNYGGGGHTIADMLTQYAGQAGNLVSSNITDGQPHFFNILGGINDLGPAHLRTGLATYTDLAAIWAAARADGYIIVANTDPGYASTTPEIQAQIDDFNTRIRSDQTLYDILIDTALEMPATVGGYFLSDGIHLSDSGVLYYANLVSTAIKSLIPAVILPQYPGQAKLNIVAESHPTDTTLTPGHTYKLADSHQIRTALGWTWGVDHWAFTDVGVPKVITGATLLANGIGPKIWANEDQVTILK